MWTINLAHHQPSNNSGNIIPLSNRFDSSKDVSKRNKMKLNKTKLSKNDKNKLKKQKKLLEENKL